MKHNEHKEVKNESEKQMKKNNGIGTQCRSDTEYAADDIHAGACSHTEV